MTTTQLTAPVDEELAAFARAQAERAGLETGEYVARLIAADRAAASGTPAEQRARADRLAAVAYHHWAAAGHPEEGALTLDETFA
ncbi:hypothetical protein [Kitasatospora camelliae]|uniref:Antitoxin n=1 Tax=Kitasatospora camelliae TaxID=3156397 RepID=A0AAU8JRD0_9ACTN